LTLSPILRVLSTLKKHKVKSLLIGGQACILYGGAEFSRDSDFVVLAEPENLEALKRALLALKAAPVYFPELTLESLLKGHGCHFRCGARGVEDLRVDVMGKLKGCEPFEKLWARRNKVRLPGLGVIDVLSLPDLVESKKTQRDKDWLMLARLVDSDVYSAGGKGRGARLNWWLAQARTPTTLLELCAAHPAAARKAAASRPLLRAALRGDLRRLELQLKSEESAERRRDKAYWLPLKAELEQLRLARPRRGGKRGGV
jgi:hypothetical protein